MLTAEDLGQVFGLSHRAAHRIQLVKAVTPLEVI